MKKLKYLFVFILPLGVFFAFNRQGWSTFSPIIFTFVLIPFLELFLKPDKENFDQESMKKEKSSTSVFLSTHSNTDVELFSVCDRTDPNILY